MKVKNKQGQEFEVSEEYFENYKDSLEVIKTTKKKASAAETSEE